MGESIPYLFDGKEIFKTYPQGETLWFGYLPNMNQETLCKVLTEFQSWTHQQGFKVLLGPIEGSTLGAYRYRLNAFGETPFWGEPPNDQLPVEVLTSLGYKIDQKYFSYVCHSLQKLEGLAQELHQKVPLAAIADLRFEQLDLSSWQNDEAAYCQAINKIFAGNYGFAPITVEQFRQVYSLQVRQMICPQTSMTVRSSKNEIVGFCVNFKDQNNSKNLLIKTVGVVPEYRRMGIVFFEMIKRLLEWRESYQSAILCLMREGNVPSIFLEHFADEVREYALFRKQL